MLFESKVMPKAALGRTEAGDAPVPQQQTAAATSQAKVKKRMQKQEESAGESSEVTWTCASFEG